MLSRVGVWGEVMNKVRKESSFLAEEPRFNEPLFDEVLGIRNDILHHSNIVKC